MGWMTRLVRHRARAQVTILATVTAVTVVGATLLGSFALLLAVNENRALDVALSRAPAAVTDVGVRLDLSPDQPARPALEAADEYLDRLLAGLPDARTHWLQSQWLAVQGTTDPVSPLVYLGAVPTEVTVVEGTWPPAADADSAVPVAVPVAVPSAAAERYDWEPGDRIAFEGTSERSQGELVVAAVYVAEPPRAAWSREVLRGRLHEAAYPYPGTFGFVTTNAWGPLLVDPDVLLSGKVATQSVQAVALPDLDHATRADVEGLRTRLSTAQQDATAASGEVAASADVTTDLDTTIDTATADLDVTHVSVVLLGLMLVVVAVTVLLLAARLLAERRAPEQTLMSSRGASGGQLLGLAASEALVVAVLTALAAPWLARLLFWGVTSVPALRGAGLHVDPGHPVSLWVTCGVGAALLAGVLVGPLLRRRGSVVDTEQQLVRQDRKQALARSGADLAVVALAAVALWQLSTQGSPVVAGSGRIDPLLVAAPALALLAGGVLAARALPLVASVGERLATRTRTLVAPLATWEVSRRPGRASGAALLLTLAIAVGTFGQGYLQTWRTSQQDQAEAAIGTDLRVVDADGTPLEQAAVVADEHALQIASPVGFADAGLGIATGREDATNASMTRLLVLDTRHTADLVRGRAPDDAPGGWAALTGGLAPTSYVTGPPVPAGTTELTLTLTTYLSLPLPSALSISLVVQDQHGLRTPLELPSFSVGSEEPVDHRVELAIPEGVGPLQIVAATARIALGEGEEPAEPGDRTLPTFAVHLTDLTARAEDGTTTPIDLTRATWVVQATTPGWSSQLPTTWADEEGMHLAGALPLVVADASAFSITSFRPEPIVHALVTPGVLEDLGADQDDTLVVDVGGAPVQLRVDRVVDYLPGMPRGQGVLVDADAISRASWARGSAATFSDEWWARVDEADAPAAAQRLTRAEMGTVTTLVGVRAEATDGPLRVGIQAALWLVIVASAGLAVAGIAMSATVAVRTRRLELARLQALGASRSSLVRAVLAEHALLGAVGIAAGLAVGYLLATVLSPVITVSAAGLPPVPPVVLQWPWAAQLAFVGGTALACGIVVLTVAQLLLRRASGALLRLGDEG
ncbi:FtsX-like permease family protein [Cellulomonas sp. DKR-3]|uniref:FtsX-like permease family protein n=1 Tax=Cellulomonas fulva TaxID=2835530 RepID=A0ABS5TUP4_9CELL|nr:FtsX-like permease family protein [Cellulomonas fulva]MBT0992842.1 FtsX-like permease family protein [Cellulomonas fulva]